MKKLFSLLALIAIVTGCYDAEWASFKAIGDPSLIIQYSGGVEIGRYCSTGKILSEDSSDGYRFMDRETNRLKSVSGDITIDYGAVECR